MRILLFGGSFDPPHLGHARLLAAGVAAVRPGRALVLPAFLAPLKTGHEAAPAERLELARLMAAALPDRARAAVEIDRFELDRSRRTYTYEWLRFLRLRNPGAELFFLAGSDALAGLARWRRPAELRRSCRWVVGRRPGNNIPSDSGATVLPGVFPPISSTDIRSALLAGLDVHGLLAPAVARFIRARELYGLGIRRAIESSLSPERWRHTAAVARWARELARLHGEDPEKAALAGLLHDCGRALDLSGMLRYVRRRRLAVPERRLVEESAPLLLHAYVSADLAQRRFGVDDPAVLSAIGNHTLGKPGMAKLDRLLYVADISSVDRAFPEAARIRRLAKRDLEAAFREAVRAKLLDVLKRGRWLHPRGAALWNRLESKI